MGLNLFGSSYGFNEFLVLLAPVTLFYTCFQTLLLCGTAVCGLYAAQAGLLGLLVKLLSVGALDSLLGGIEYLALGGHGALAHFLMLSQTVSVKVSAAKAATFGALWRLCVLEQYMSNINISMLGFGHSPFEFW